MTGKWNTLIELQIKPLNYASINIDLTITSENEEIYSSVVDITSRQRGNKQKLANKIQIRHQYKKGQWRNKLKYCWENSKTNEITKGMAGKRRRSWQRNCTHNI